MKTRIIVGVSIFIALSLWACFISWASGYNFDHRTPDVGYAVMVFSGVFAVISLGVASWEGWKK